jgi:cell division protein ZipA
MESVSLILIVVGAAIIGVIALFRLGLRGRNSKKLPIESWNGRDIRQEEPDVDPLFAIDAKKEEISDGALENVGKIAAVLDEPQPAPPASAGLATPHREAREMPPKSARRRPPRTAEDPRRVVVLNIMAREDRAFSGGAVRGALDEAGFEYGDWQIFHYYSPTDRDAPPLFSLANMVKPGSFDLERMDEMNTAGLSLFMVPAGEEGDVAAFDAMLGTARRLAGALGGEVRDARRSVLTRQAIGLTREQLNELRSLRATESEAEASSPR